MKVSYYPGCTMKTAEKKAEYQAKICAEALGFELCEIEDWQCCGGSFTGASDEIATKLSSVRALIAAGKEGRPLVTLCSACHNVLKRTNRAMAQNGEFAARVNTYLAQDKDFGGAYHGETRVYHYLEYLRGVVGFDRLSAAVKHPLSGRKIAGYYGCMLLRPAKEMETDDPENPRLFEDFIRALGGEAVVFPQRNECCGGYMATESPEAAAARAKTVIDSASGHGAELTVTACPLCAYNLRRVGGAPETVFFTELLASALGVAEESDD